MYSDILCKPQLENLSLSKSFDYFSQRSPVLSYCKVFLMREAHIHEPADGISCGLRCTRLANFCAYTWAYIFLNGDHSSYARRNVQVGQISNKKCSQCHFAMDLFYSSIKFAPREAPRRTTTRQKKGPTTVVPKAASSGQAAEAATTIGEPLPQYGTCRHYPHSHRQAPLAQMAHCIEVQISCPKRLTPVDARQSIFQDSVHTNPDYCEAEVFGWGPWPRSWWASSKDGHVAPILSAILQLTRMRGQSLCMIPVVVICWSFGVCHMLSGKCIELMHQNGRLETSSAESFIQRRWLRFPCCGRRFPCDVCHEEETDGHDMKWAMRHACGFCSTEQVNALIKQIATFSSLLQCIGSLDLLCRYLTA